MPKISPHVAAPNPARRGRRRDLPRPRSRRSRPMARPALRVASAEARPKPRPTQKPARLKSGPAGGLKISPRVAAPNPARRGRRRDPPRPRSRRAHPTNASRPPAARPEPRATQKGEVDVGAGECTMPHPPASWPRSPRAIATSARSSASCPRVASPLTPRACRARPHLVRARGDCCSLVSPGEGSSSQGGDLAACATVAPARRQLEGGRRAGGDVRGAPGKVRRRKERGRGAAGAQRAW